MHQLCTTTTQRVREEKDQKRQYLELEQGQITTNRVKMNMMIIDTYVICSPMADLML